MYRERAENQFIQISRHILGKLLSRVPDTPYFRLEKNALIANAVFFKTLSRSIYTRFMIEGGGQGFLKRKNY